MKNKRYFPLYVDLSDKNVVVVGNHCNQKSKGTAAFYKEYNSNCAKNDSGSVGAWKAW